jgi:hypothetical protein
MGCAEVRTSKAPGLERRGKMLVGRRSRLLLALVLSLVLMGAGCAYRYRFDTGLPKGDHKETRWAHIGFYGWATPEPFDLEEMCPEGVAVFGSHINLLNWFPTLLTVGLYSPRTVVAWCAQPEAVQ